MFNICANVVFVFKKHKINNLIDIKLFIKFFSKNINLFYF